MHLLTVEEAAKRLGVSVKKMRNLYQSRLIPHYRLGYRTVRLKVEDIERFAMRHREEAVR